MTKLIFILLLLITSISIVSGQVCTHTKLSDKFSFKTEIERIKVTDDLMDSCIITITIIDKMKNKEIRKISYSATGLFGDAFRDCDFVRSYSTHQNEKSEVSDNNFGDLIVADLNFDNKDDFAIKENSGGNGGPGYNYYIQKNGQFVLDKFLTERMAQFPTIINKHNKTLTTIVHANARQFGKTTYKFEKGKWEKVKHIYVANH